MKMWLWFLKILGVAGFSVVLEAGIACICNILMLLLIVVLVCYDFIFAFESF